MIITELMLDSLRERVSATMSPKRFYHTAEVEKMAAYIGSIYAPDKVMMLRAAALLHDVTKEYSTERQLEICKEKCVELDADACFAPKTLHARTAAALIPEEYPEFADEEIIRCVRWHTTGREGMTLEERIIYLADYIDMSRRFEDCVRLREYFFSAELQTMKENERSAHLRRTLIMSYDMTMRGLLGEGLPINRDTVAARNELVREELASKLI
ncbi:MAG: HD domain-containing protein [Ruminococcaceae bacterium]|nr:HD domain-containing protein [Oscillospiraceae bacterium]